MLSWNLIYNNPLKLHEWGRGGGDLSHGSNTKNIFFCVSFMAEIIAAFMNMVIGNFE